MLRDNHYDLAFQSCLQSLRIPHVAVDETRRALMQEESLKSLDFIVSPPQAQNLLVDVKGRRFPSGQTGRGSRWESWVTEDDIVSMLHWQDIFGLEFRALLVFVYHLHEAGSENEFEETFSFRRRTYTCFGVWADEYQNEMRGRSTSWKTVTLPRSVFHALKRPLSAFLGKACLGSDRQDIRYTTAAGIAGSSSATKFTTSGKQEVS